MVRYNLFRLQRLLMNRVNRLTIPIGVIPQHTIIVIVCLYNISQAIKYIKKYIKMLVYK